MSPATATLQLPLSASISAGVPPLDALVVEEVGIGLLLGRPGVGLEAAGQVADVLEPRLLEDAIGEIAAQADLAEDHHRPVGIEFAESIAQMVEFEVAGPGQRLDRELLGRAHVDELDRSGRGLQDVAQLAPIDDLVEAREHVAGDVAGDVDGILRRAEGRRIGELEIGQVLHPQAGFDRRGDDVDALVHPVRADRLRAEDAAVEAEDQLQAELPAAGIIGRMRAGMNDDRAVGDARAPWPAFR